MARIRMRGGDHPAARGILFFVFGMFLLVGTIVAVPLTLFPWMNYLNAAEWERVPCRILSAEVRTHRGSKGSSTWSVDVAFAYEYDGRERRSDRASFFTGSSSGRASKEAHARRLLEDPAPTCLVNPANPDEAVLDRSLGPLAILSLLPLVFVLIGGAGLAFAIRATLRGSAPSAPGASPPPRLPAARPAAPPMRTRDGWYELTAAGPSRVLPFILILFAVGWNGVVCVALASLASGAFAEDSLFAGLFLTPFVLVGVALAGFATHGLLALRNPRLIAELTEPTVAPGEPFRLRWKIHPPDPLTRLAFRLICRETRESWEPGRSHETSTRTLAEHPLFETTQKREFARGERTCAFPADGPAPVAEPDRRIAWFLVASGEIPRWPDLSAEFELPVAAGGERHA